MRPLIPVVLLSWWCLAAAAAPAAPVMISKLKPLYPSTPLVVNGEAAAVIVTPDDPQAVRLAATLAARLGGRAGTGPAILPANDLISEDWAIRFDLIAGRTLIALGNVNNNRLLAVLWGEGYEIADSIYPGEDGYVVRTVHDPFGRGWNVLVLAGSDAKGVQRAVDVFLAKYLPQGGSDLVLPAPVADIRFAPVNLPFLPEPAPALEADRQPQRRTMEYFRRVFAAAGLMDAAGRVQRLENGTLVTVTGAIARLAETWFQTGDPALPPLMKEIVDRNRHLLQVAAPRVEMQPRSCMHLIWWDIVEELPVWTDQDRLEITNAFLTDARVGHERRRAHAAVKEGYIQVSGENHDTAAAWHDYQLWSYFEKYYADVLPEENQYYKDVAQATYLGQCSSHQILEDASDYLCYAPGTTMQYATAARDLRYFTSGIARGYAEFIAQCSMNNLGLSTGFGDSPYTVVVPASDVIARAAWFYRDPRLAWIQRNLVPRQAALSAFLERQVFDLSVAPVEPAEWTGMTVFPIYVQDLPNYSMSKTPVFSPRQSLEPEWFNKIVFRDRWDPDGQYLLLDGAGRWMNFQPEGYPKAGPAGHNHDDVNTVLNYTDKGRMWLVDHTYSTRGIHEHSGLAIARDGETTYRGKEAKLQDGAEGSGLAVSRSLFEGYSGADWERAIFWRRGRYFVVIDLATAREPGHYAVRCNFRGLGRPDLRGATLRLEQQGKYCDIVSDGGALLGIEDFTYESQYWTQYPYAEPVARIFQQDKSARLERGERLGFANLLAAADNPAGLDAIRLTPLSDAAVRVETADGPAVYGVGDVPGGAAVARTFAVRREGALFSGLTRLGMPGSPVLQAGAPVTVICSGAGTLEVETAVPVAVTLAGGEILQLAAGRHRIDRPDAAAQAHRAVESILAAAGAMPAYRAPAAAGGPDAPPLESKQISLHTGVADVKAADLDGDGKAEWVTAGPAGVSAFRPDGTALWTCPTPKPCVILETGDVDGDGTMELAAGCEDFRVYLIGADGRPRWNFPCPAAEFSVSRPPIPDWIKIMDLDGDGTVEILAGANWLHCLDPAGREKWKDCVQIFRGKIAGDFGCGAVADFTGSGRNEVLALYHYIYAIGILYGADGRVIVPPERNTAEKMGINIDQPRCLLVTDVYGQGGPPHFIIGGDNWLAVYRLYGALDEFNVGNPVHANGFQKDGGSVALALLETPGAPPMIYSATGMGAVLALRAGAPGQDQKIAMTVPWKRVLGAGITALWAGDADGDGRAELLAGVRPGAVHVLDALTGEPLGTSVAVESPMVRFLAVEGLVCAFHADGTVERIHLDPRGKR